MSKDLLFDIPEDYARELVEKKREGSSYRIIDGVVKGRSQSIWFTNLHHKKRNEELILYKKYSPEEYPHYDNYDAIEVSKTNEIPEDWGGAMGVPITFLDKYNPEQFEILDANDIRINDAVPGKPHGLIKDSHGTHPNRERPVYARVIIRNKHPRK